MEKNNSCKTVGQFTQQLQDIETKLAHDKIQRLNCVMGNFNMKMKEKLVEIIGLQPCGLLKLEHA